MLQVLQGKIQWRHNMMLSVNRRQFDISENSIEYLRIAKNFPEKPLEF